ncbi:FlhC family transcriptional regulator [Duganella vulcania]|uniref:Flagellar transcriptional regulator FlhC n=1 Tax=Duganella vulcania TaxID=2692166 RepID=A0A845GMZ5_9BURK|nr:FlhC family transcriptional regulator [Duganella vulcania]MYM95933.1 hypothetical protein [Duganella vulcania]
MARAYIERHIHTLTLAHACFQLGARMRTTSHITGMSHAELCKFYLPGESAFHAGRLPASPDWLMAKTNCLDRAELSVFAAILQRVLAQDIAPGDALVGAYRLYAGSCAVQPRVSFDRAFDVACHLKGIWTHRTASIALYACPRCDSYNLSSMGDEKLLNRGCVFCRLLARYEKDPRVRAGFPKRRRPGPSSRASGLPRILAGA